MKKHPEFYKCQVCGNIVDIIEDSGDKLICCGKPLKVMKPNTEEGSTEKHLPAAEIDGDTITVKVGAVEHPMLDEHFIKWITVMSADRIQRVTLAPHQKPEAVFTVPESGDVYIYEYCNIHGLWQTTVTK